MLLLLFVYVSAYICWIFVLISTITFHINNYRLFIYLSSITLACVLFAMLAHTLLFCMQNSIENTFFHSQFYYTFLFFDMHLCYTYDDNMANVFTCVLCFVHLKELFFCCECVVKNHFSYVFPCHTLLSLFVCEHNTTHVYQKSRSSKLQWVGLHFITILTTKGISFWRKWNERRFKFCLQLRSPFAILFFTSSSSSSCYYIQYILFVDWSPSSHSPQLRQYSHCVCELFLLLYNTWHNNKYAYKNYVTICHKKWR